MLRQWRSQMGFQWQKMTGGRSGRWRFGMTIHRTSRSRVLDNGGLPGWENSRPDHRQLIDDLGPGAPGRNAVYVQSTSSMMSLVSRTRQKPQKYKRKRPFGPEPNITNPVTSLFHLCHLIFVPHNLHNAFNNKTLQFTFFL